jgi:myo-inositol catabolism protein IolC
MRTTIELSNDHRAQLLHIAAERGAKGFSDLIAEAIALYLKAKTRQDDAVERALLLKGCLRDKEGAKLELAVRDIRGRWRSDS